MRTNEMMILYTAVTRIKVSPVQDMIRQWLTNFKMMGSIECTSLISHIVTNLGITQGPNVPSIANPQTQINKAYLTQWHILKKDPDDSLVFFYSGHTNQIRLPNPDFKLYDEGLLIFPLEGRHHSSVYSDRVTRSASRRAAGAQQPPPQLSP
jgi:hypothetical protein